LDGKEVIVLQLTRRDNYREHYYFDTKSNLLVASSGEAPIHAFGEKVLSFTRISDYREVNGLMIAHRFDQVQLPSNELLSSMHWGKIESNVDFPENWFGPPSDLKTPIQTFIENLFIQLADITAMLWTYFEFRRANSELATFEAVDFVAFHMLKMGDIENAIRILEQNLIDYPTKSQ